MDALNPYASPTVNSPRLTEPSGGGLSLRQALLTIAATGGGGALLGAGLGCLIGLNLPDYYHAVFGNPSLNAVKVGLGLGLTQGLGVGLGIGVFVVLAMAISIRRRLA